MGTRGAADEDPFWICPEPLRDHGWILFPVEEKARPAWLSTHILPASSNGGADWRWYFLRLSAAMNDLALP